MVTRGRQVTIGSAFAVHDVQLGGGMKLARRHPPAGAPSQPAPADEEAADRALSPQQQRSRKARSLALGVVLAALAALFYVVTIVKLGAGILVRPL